jgi:hypothetical protein
MASFAARMPPLSSPGPIGNPLVTWIVDRTGRPYSCGQRDMQ